MFTVNKMLYSYANKESLTKVADVLQQEYDFYVDLYRKRSSRYDLAKGNR